MGTTVNVVRVDFPRLLIEKNRNGTKRYRVRVEGKKCKRMTVPVGPEHSDFPHHYYAARVGETWSPSTLKVAERSLDWLVGRYLDFLSRMVEAGQMFPATLKQRRSVLTRLCNLQDHDGTRYGDCNMNAPTSAFIEIRDAWASPPSPRSSRQSHQISSSSLFLGY